MIRYNMDIVCFQECTKTWKSMLTVMLNPFEYEYVSDHNGIVNYFSYK